MNNREFIRRLRKVRKVIAAEETITELTLFKQCVKAGVGWRPTVGATFGEPGSSFFGNSSAWISLQESDYKTAALAVIDNSIEALVKEVSK